MKHKTKTIRSGDLVRIYAVKIYISFKKEPPGL
jgi:hypothetical protein